MSRADVVSSFVTLDVWRIPGRRIPAVAWRFAADRRRLRRLPGVSFAKLLGTGRGFGPGSADPTRWAAVLAWDDDAAAGHFDSAGPARRWHELAVAHCRLDLVPLTSRGSWAGRAPFRPGQPAGDTPILALTRARLRPSRAVAFWRALRSPARAVCQAHGLLAAFGIGEAPIGWQGTVSLWRTERDLVEFAYRHPDHRRVIDATLRRRWYAEELFARFAVVAVTGDRDVIGWCGEEDGPVQDPMSARR